MAERRAVLSHVVHVHAGGALRGDAGFSFPEAADGGTGVAGRRSPLHPGRDGAVGTHGSALVSPVAVVSGILYDGGLYPLPLPEKGRKPSEKRISLRGSFLPGRGRPAVSSQALVRDSAAV